MAECENPDSQMGQRKRKWTAAEKAEKKRRQREYMTIFVNGKQKRVKRPQTIDGIPEDEFIRNNADPIWLLQEGMYEELSQWEQERDAGNGDEFSTGPACDSGDIGYEDDEYPF